MILGFPRGVPCFQPQRARPFEGANDPDPASNLALTSFRRSPCRPATHVLA